jgi:hypothetical protein
MRVNRAYSAILSAFFIIVLSAVCFAQEEPQLTEEQKREFLVNAKVIKYRRINQGVTNPYQLTLSDGKITHDAHFQSVNERKSYKRLERGSEINFVDSYLYNIAAYELAKLLGLQDMVPVTVERKWGGNLGSIAWWLPVQMSEGERIKRKRHPPDIRAWNNSMYKLRVFAELIYDTDRSNPGNILIGKNWELYMVDFTRAFRLYYDLRSPENLVCCSRKLLEKLQALNGEELTAKVGEYLNSMEIEGIMKRRDKIVEYFERLIAEKGEHAVLY